MKDKRDLYSQLRRAVREAADRYWCALTEAGWGVEQVDRSRRELAALALRLHVFEQGRRSKR